MGHLWPTLISLYGLDNYFHDLCIVVMMNSSLYKFGKNKKRKLASLNLFLKKLKQLFF